MRCSFRLLVFASLLLSACYGCGKLSNDAAQLAIDQWAGDRGVATVKGIIEVPTENSAKADILCSNLNFSFKKPMFGQLVIAKYSGPAIGIFSHYNDGRWILTKVTFSNLTQWGPMQWDT
jgi:hypothetical protein